MENHIQRCDATQAIKSAQVHQMRLTRQKNHAPLTA
jgi:hypothetical protein